MNTHCQPLISHISRLQGQLEKLKSELESNASCDKITHLALSASKSFDSLRASILEQFVQDHLLSGKSPDIEEWKHFQQLLKLVKA
jgi:DNA-binding FrmR family transcriptional regulator